MSTGNVQGTGATAAANQPTAAAARSAAVKALAAQVTSGDFSGLGLVQGQIRNYNGHGYVTKPSWLAAALHSKAAMKAYKDQKAIFKEQRVMKHQDRILREIQKEKPDVARIKKSVGLVLKHLDVNKLKLRHLIPLDSTQDVTTRSTAAVKLHRLTQDFLAAEAPPRGSKLHSYFTSLGIRLGNLVESMPTNEELKQFRAADQGQFAAQLKTRRTGANAAADGATAAQRKAAIDQFRAVDAKQYLDKTRFDWKVSEGGASGVILVFAKGTNNLVGVLKPDGAAKMAAAEFMGGVLEHFQSHSGKSLPFDLPKHQKLEADPQGSPASQKFHRELRVALLDQKNAEESPRAKVKCDRYMTNVDEAKAVMRYEPVKAKSLESFPIGERIEIYNSEGFASDLAAVGVLGPFFGMGDHVGAIRGYTNFENLMIGDNGRMTIIDMEAATDQRRLPDGTTVDCFGYSQQEMVGGITQFCSLLSDVLEGRLPLDEVVKQAQTGLGHSRLCEAIKPIFRPRGHVFEEAAMTQDMVSPQEHLNLVTRMVASFGEHLAFLKSEAANIGAAHDSMPLSSIHGQGAATMQQVAAAIDAFDRSRPGGALAELSAMMPGRAQPVTLPPLPVDAASSSEG